MPGTLRTLLATARVPFLLLPPVCVGLGFAAASWSGHPVGTLRAALVLLGAICAHVSVNMLNEWADFRSGLDAITVRTPFSGGSGAQPADPQAVGKVLTGGIVALLVTAGIGLWLLATQGAALLPIGLAGLLLLATYTPWITHHPLACLLAPGLGFGPLMTGGAAAAVAGVLVPQAFVASLVPLALVSGLLLLNQFPDVEADRTVGRQHIPLLWGRPRAAGVLAALFAFAYAALMGGVLAGALTRGAMAGLLTAPLAWSVARDARRYADDLPRLVPAMGRNVALTLLTPLLMAAGGSWLRGP